MLWADAWRQCRRIFSYTNHTLMPEALETWPVSLFQYLLPRHMRIIFRINQEFLQEVALRFPGDVDLIRRMSLIDDGDGSDDSKRVRMAHLSIVGSHRVNGVSQLHSDLMVQTIFADFAKLFPERFHNKTNGVTPRRWLCQANPGLSPDRQASWQGLAAQPGSPEGTAPGGRRRAVPQRFRRREARQQGASGQLHPARDRHHSRSGQHFDVQVKRIHEYKRQLLNLLHVVTTTTTSCTASTATRRRAR
jgi:Glucan phosphorylase